LCGVVSHVQAGEVMVAALEPTCVFIEMGDMSSLLVSFFGLVFTIKGALYSFRAWFFPINWVRSIF
jgi:hypothetical protein